MEDLEPKTIPPKTALKWNCPEALELWSNWDQFAVASRVFYRKWAHCNRNHEISQAVVPSVVLADVLYQLHDSPLSGGNFAVEKTLSRRFWWPGLRPSVENMLPNVLSVPLGIPRVKSKSKFAISQRDGPVSDDNSRHLRAVTLAKLSQAKYIFVISDLYTKYVVAVPVKDITSKTMAMALVERWFLKFGARDTLHTDQGTNFNNEVMLNICISFMINKTSTSSYDPQGNGHLELLNRIIADTLSKDCVEIPHK